VSDLGDDLWDSAGRPVPLLLPTVADTEALGARLAGLLRAGDLVVLSGPLGAGKTALVRGLAAGLGVQGRVTSPTFVLARVHRGPVPLLHVDAYRLRDAGVTDLSALEDLDLDAALEDGVTVVEWGEGLVEGLTPSWLSVRLERADDDVRTARVQPVGPRWGPDPALSGRAPSG
jgi:tRNA threonylcarbamoyladenosine biosynthesis protein TsaE